MSQQNALDRQLTVWENLYFHGRLFGIGGRRSRERADELLSQFQLTNWARASLRAVGLNGPTPDGRAPFLVCFVFLFVFPKNGQGIGGRGDASESAFARCWYPAWSASRSCSRACSQSHSPWRRSSASPGRSKTVYGPRARSGSSQSRKVLSGAAQGLLSALIVLPIVSIVHARGVYADISAHWLVIVTLVPLACITMASLGLVLGTSFEPRNIGLMFGFIILPITFLGGTYYSRTRVAPVTVGSWHWLQTLVLVNPLIYVNEGMRAAFTNAPHMHLYVLYPVILVFTTAFLSIGLRNLRRRVLA